jgi:hypothetical protein
VEIGGNDANVTNSGTIEGETGVVFEGTGGTLTASGKIVGTGGVAVNIGDDNTLDVEAGATFVGKVIDPGGSDTLELSGGAPGTLAGLGTSIVGFDAAVIDADATWTLLGPNSIDTLRNDGAATLAAGGSLDVATIDPNSTGVFNLGHDSTLDVGEAPGAQARIDFLGDARLVVERADAFGTSVGAPSHAGPLLQGFAGGDTIDLRDVASAGLQIHYVATSGLLKIRRAGMIEANLLFQSFDPLALSLHLAPDGHGGTLLKA